jgi:hypothetical protein
VATEIVERSVMTDRKESITSKQAKRWKRPISDAVLRHMRRGESMTVDELVDEIAPPATERREVCRLIWSLLKALEYRGALVFIPEDASSSLN